MNSLNSTSWFDWAIRQIAIASISSYQKYLSPHKGFSCAHRLLYGGESCSQYVKRAIAQQGLAAALQSSRQRFEACRKANRILQARYSRRYNHETDSESSDNNNTSSKRKRSRLWHSQSHASNCMDSCSDNTLIQTCELGGEMVNCSLSSCQDVLDCGSRFDCRGMHCDLGLDCGGLDCGGLDCGSCG